MSILSQSKHIKPPQPTPQKPFGTIHPNSAQFKKEMEQMSDLYSKGQTSDTTNQFKKEIKKARRAFKTYKPYTPTQPIHPPHYLTTEEIGTRFGIYIDKPPTPTNTPRFLSILKDLKQRYGRKPKKTNPATPNLPPPPNHQWTHTAPHHPHQSMRQRPRTRRRPPLPLLYWFW